MKASSAEMFMAASLDSTLLASRYETLRRAALGEPVSPEDRSGLGLLLRRGVLGWAQAAFLATPRQLARPSSTGSAWGSQQQQPVVQVLAAMALGFKKEIAR